MKWAANFLKDHIKRTRARTVKEMASWRFPNYPAASNLNRTPELTK